MASVTAEQVIAIAHEAGFELAGIAQALPHPDFARYQEWVELGMAGKMGYLTDRRAGVRSDPRHLLPSAKSILCLGKLYQTAHPPATAVSRYAWGDDYHDVLRPKLEWIVARLREISPPGEADFEYKLSIDTAPLLERSYARSAGLGWIGRNTCLIREGAGSWFFLAEILLSLELGPNPTLAPDRCGTCRRCIEACPTEALVPDGSGGFRLDARLCISYLTIELRGPVPEELRPGVGGRVFGCDICQDVCPWNHRSPVTDSEAFEPRAGLGPNPETVNFPYLSPEEFRLLSEGSPVSRAKYRGFLRNVAVALGNTKRPESRKALEHLAKSGEECVGEHALWALRQLDAAAGGVGDDDDSDSAGLPDADGGHGPGCGC